MKKRDFDKSFHYFQNLLNLDFNNENLMEYTKLIMDFYQTTNDKEKTLHYISYLEKFGLRDEIKYIKDMLGVLDRDRVIRGMKK
jgi:hypothetical protein